ncbi:MAG: hypothetical protein ABW117_18400, partial [Candidatus Sedimenticola sp. 1PA]
FWIPDLRFATSGMTMICQLKYFLDSGSRLRYVRNDDDMYVALSNNNIAFWPLPGAFINLPRFVGGN